VVEVCEEGKRIVEFNADKDKVLEIVNKIGHVPLPPYIKREEKEEDRTNYQTIFAREEGAVAAPTAGLHFTEELVKKIVEKGVKIVPITLHVGPGTFKPVKTKVVEEHKLDPEVFYVSEETAEVINNRKGRLIAVGTTVVRTLESCADERGKVKPGRGETSLFIYPGYKFKVVEALITNFHLPKSTLLMLVCAFAGKERVLNAYAEAVKLRYRFYSYGDAMFIV
jgi:S-adenosylmethionine:tRNA ribosyltransferase-isomerase